MWLQEKRYLGAAEAILHGTVEYDGPVLDILESESYQYSAWTC